MPSRLSHRPTRWVLVTILVVAVAFLLGAVGVLVSSYLSRESARAWSGLGILAVVPLMLFAFLNLGGHPVGRVRIAPNGAATVSTAAEGALLVLGLVATAYFTLERHLLGTPVDPGITQARVLAAMAFFPSVVLVLRSVRLLRSARARATGAA